MLRTPAQLFFFAERNVYYLFNSAILTNAYIYDNIFLTTLCKDGREVGRLDIETLKYIVDEQLNREGLSLRKMDSTGLHSVLGAFYRRTVSIIAEKGLDEIFCVIGENCVRNAYFGMGEDYDLFRKFVLSFASLGVRGGKTLKNLEASEVYVNLDEDMPKVEEYDAAGQFRRIITERTRLRRAAKSMTFLLDKYALIRLADFRGKAEISDAVWSRQKNGFKYETFRLMSEESANKFADALGLDEAGRKELLSRLIRTEFDPSPIRDELRALIKSNGFSYEEIRIKAGISLKAWESFQKNSSKKTSQNTLIKIFIAAEISPDKAQELLAAVGGSFFSRRDKIILCCMRVKVYDRDLIEEILDIYMKKHWGEAGSGRLYTKDKNEEE